jgi:hypothetical protein
MKQQLRRGGRGDGNMKNATKQRQQPGKMDFFFLARQKRKGAVTHPDSGAAVQVPRRELPGALQLCAKEGGGGGVSARVLLKDETATAGGADSRRKCQKLCGKGGEALDVSLVFCFSTLGVTHLHRASSPSTPASWAAGSSRT